MFFTDESGSKGSGGQFFVLGGIKTRNPGHLLRSVKAVRDDHGFFRELKFVDLTARSIRIYSDLIEVLWESDVHLIAFVIDKNYRDPFAGVPHWTAHAKVTAQLIHGNINRAEVATLLMDICSTPKGFSVDESVRSQVNERFGSMNLVSAVSLDSRTSDGLQLADLVAGAISYDRRFGSDSTKSSSPKSIVSKKLAAQFGLGGFDDTRNRRVNILTSRPRR